MTLQQVTDELKAYNGRKVKIMEVCGTHTASIFKNGIRSLLSSQIELISGPGCPVCVTSCAFIDKLIDYSLKEGYCVLTFGDMMKVKGEKLSLTEAKAIGGNVKILYSPLSAIKLAQENPNTQFIFAAVGFETTVPIYAVLMEEILQENLMNIKLLTSIKTILPALSFICETEENIDGFICPGHVSVITGCEQYEDLAKKYEKPFVITGFSGEHILASVYEIIRQITNKQYSMKNLYESVVLKEGNQKATTLVNQYFQITNEIWRGIGMIPDSGLKLREEYAYLDAGSDFSNVTETVPKGCKCKEVILGRIHPIDCPLFKKTCTPFHAVGPCMVSAEGACGIWYKNS